MADDAGALLVRSGLVSSNALDDARARVASVGGTLGEQLVTSGAIADDDLTDFYRSRLLVPQVNPNTLARLTPTVVATIPGDMAIELRAIPVSLDGDNNLTVAMSDPSDRHAVDEIAFFTGAYIVRAVATQMQIAWCLAHYYGHVTALGQRLLRTSQSSSPIKGAASTAARVPRVKGLTSKVNAARHRAIAPVTGPVDVLRPSSGELDLRPLDEAGSVLPSAMGNGQGPAVQPSAGSGSTGDGAKAASPVRAAGAKSASPAAAAGSASAADSAPQPATAASPASATMIKLAGASASAAGAPTVKLSGAANAAGPAASAPAAAAPGDAVTAKLASPTSAAAAASASAPATTGGQVNERPASAGSAAAAAPGGAVTAKLASPTSAAAAASASAPATTGGPMNAKPASTGSAAPAASATTAKLTSPSAAAPAASAAAASSAAAAPPAGQPGAAAGASSRRTTGTPPVGMASTPAQAGASSSSEAADDGPDLTPSAAVRPRPAGLTPPSAGRPAPAAVTAAPSARPVPAAGPSAPSPIPGVYSSDDALPLPMLDESVSGPVLDDALPTPVLDEPSAKMASVQELLAEDTAEPPRAHSISGEIRVPGRRAPSIKPLPGNKADDDDEPLIMIERSEDAPTPRPVPRRRAVKSDPPELYARAGEVDLKTGSDHAIDDEPRIVVDEDALAPTTGRIAARPAPPDDAAPEITVIDPADDADTGAVIRDRASDHESQPILLDRPRSESDQLSQLPGAAHSGREDDEDTGEVDIVVLDSPKRPRPERRTRVGVPPAPVNAPPPPDLDRPEVVGDATTVDLHAAPPGEDTTSDQLAAPPAPASDADTNPHLVAPPPTPGSRAPAIPRSGSIPAAVIVEDEDDDEPPGPRTAEMTAIELDDAIPERSTELPEQLLGRGARHAVVDDGWGPPGTTIPPPLLGAIPGNDDDDDEISGTIPMPSIDSSPLLVGPPSLPSSGESSAQSLVRALEEATARAIEVIRQLEPMQRRDEIVDLLVAYLAETHHRAGFFVTRHTAIKDAGELVLFAMTPRPAVAPTATLRLDRPSTLQDIAGTRLPYRGPMHDNASRAFLISTLGACPPEILLIPVAVRERVVGVLFGEHRRRHTFDDQLALAARAAGMALERLLRSKRG